MKIGLVAVHSGAGFDMDRFCPLLLLAILLISPFSLRAQNGTANTSTSLALPTDPEEFLKLAAKVNGLAADSIVPWHVHATFQILDEAGKVQESGTYEAFWKSPDKYKMIYSSPSYNRTIWANDSGNFATTNPKWPGQIEWMIRRSLFDVTPEPRMSESWETHDGATSNGIKLKCLSLHPPMEGLSPRKMPSYCFDPGTPVLRLGSEAFQFYQATFNNIAHIQGAYVAKDVRLIRAGHSYFQIHVESLDALPDIDESIFLSDPGVPSVPRRLIVDSDVRSIQTVYESGPVCCYLAPPDSIGTNQQQGSLVRKEGNLMRRQESLMYDRAVIVQVLVDKKGKVRDARPISGDLRAQSLALAGARKWEFKPFIVQGEPHEFYTELEFF